MAGNLTNVAEQIALDAICGVASPLFTAPLKVRLMTAMGDDATAGTEVTGGTYASQTVAFAAAVQSGAGPAKTTNTGALAHPGMPACNVVGFEVWDSAATPRRLCWIPATQSKSVNAGDTYQIAAGALELTLD